MKIGLLTPFYPSAILSEAALKKYGFKTQHPHTWITNIAEGLARLDNTDVWVLTISKHFPMDTILEVNGVKYCFLRGRHRAVKALTFFESDRWQVLRFLRQAKFDIVHGQGINSYGYFAVTSNLPCVVTIHLYMESYFEFFRHSQNGTLSGVYFGLGAIKNQAYIMKRAKNIISIAPFIRESLHKKRSDWNIYDIENAVSLDFFQTVSVSNKGFALFIGSIDDRKSILELLEAVRQSNTIRLKIVSTTQQGEYLQKVQDFVSDNQLNDRVEFLGPKKNNDLVNIVKDCSFVVLPSKNEAAPMVISEAMAIGKPVVASNIAGIPAMVDDGETGFLVEVGDVEQLKEKMELLLGNRELCDHMGRNAKENARSRWHPDVVAEKTMEVYKNVLERYRSDTKNQK